MTDETDGDLSLGDNTILKTEKIIWGKKLAGLFYY
jgi:hypothetical protein